MDIFSSIESQLGGAITVDNYPIVTALLTVLIFSYGSLLAPTLPPKVLALFDTVYFRIFFISLVLWVSTHNPVVSVALAITFVILVNLASGKSLLENFEGPQTAVIPPCLNYTVFDLLESFNGDKTALLQAMWASQVPDNIHLTDDFAGLIATYLIGHGYRLKAGPCNAPGVGYQPEA